MSHAICASYYGQYKPTLIEPKLLKYYYNKFRVHEQKVQKELTTKISELWYQKILRNIWDFIKENYGCFMLVTSILVLLYVRYIEVNKKKIKVKKIIDKINKEKEIKQFIELQKINQELEELQMKSQNLNLNFNLPNDEEY
jgi:hypothetical protein